MYKWPSLQYSEPKVGSFVCYYSKGIQFSATCNKEKVQNTLKELEPTLVCSTLFICHSNFKKYSLSFVHTT